MTETAPRSRNRHNTVLLVLTCVTLAVIAAQRSAGTASGVEASRS